MMGGLTPEAEVLERSARRCCICYGLYGDLACKRGQIAHLDRNHQNNNVDNLAFLCLEHHDEYDTPTSQSKGWTIREAKRYRTMLYDKIEEMRQTPQSEMRVAVPQYRLPVFGQVLRQTRYGMNAIDRNTGQEYGVPAYPLLYKASFAFDVTNPNPLDMRILRFYVDVTKFIDADIVDVWWGDMGGGMRVREFGCEIEPKVGSYECVQISDGFDYIKLSSGEMEAFCINVNAIAEGVYWLRLGMEYSIGGQTKKIEMDNEIVEIGIFDPVFHKPVHTSELGGS